MTTPYVQTKTTPGPVTSYFSKLQNPEYTFTGQGNYTVTLTTTNAAGSNTVTRTKYITVTAASATPVVPVAGFTGTPVSGTAPLKVIFTDTSTNSPTSWIWSFGDGSSVNATAKNPIHTYSAAGTYTVTLTATNAAGSNSVTRTNYITVNPASADSAEPVAGFTGTPVSGTAPLKVIFTDTSTNSPTSWIWSFGDGSSVNATAKNPIHTYSAAGTYTVTLTATNTEGSDNFVKTNFVTVTSSVNQPPVLSSIPDKTVNEGVLLRFTISATDPEGNSMTYDASKLPANSRFDSATHTFYWMPAYDQAGTYTVMFRVGDGVRADTTDVKITVKDTPTKPEDVHKKYYIRLQ